MPSEAPDVGGNSPSGQFEVHHRPFLSAKVPSQRFASDHGLSQHRAVVSEEDADAILQQFADSDDQSQKTWSRMVVEKYLMHKNWYYPARPNRPSLSKAWAYYEHITLPRHFVGDDHAATVMRRSEPGETEKTELFHPFFTPQSSLIEWGTGIDLYFISLRFFSVILFLAGLINIVAIRYYDSDEYDGGNSDELASIFLRGSAVCTNTAWVVCENCKKDDWTRDEGRYATGIGPGGVQRTLALRNFCPGAELETGITNLATLVFLFITVGIFSYYLRLREIRFDEDKVTTTDYSVVVRNPPPEAIDPDEWRDFFEKYADYQVTCVTVALNNEQMIRKLITRRIYRNQLRVILPPSIDLDNENAVRVAIDLYNREQMEQETGCLGWILETLVFPPLRLLGMFLKPDVLADRIVKLTEEIKELQEKDYDAAEVFVTFETEEGQRAALSALTTSKMNLATNNTHAMPPGTVFRDRVLDVGEPPEPDAVRWLDLSASRASKLFWRGVTLTLTVALVAIASVTIQLARTGSGPLLAANLTTLWNTLIPTVIKLAMMFEQHADEGGRQASMYLKITLFRWVLSGILIQILTPFTSTLGTEPEDMIPAIAAILFSDAWLSPLLRIIDIGGNVNKHIFAPRATTQEGMNLNFQGTFYNMGERYTDFTKVLFVCFFYSAVFPAGFFFGSVILLFQYIVDKFCLMRIWGWTPSLGSQLAEFSRRYFFSGALIAYAITSAYAFVQFPYDNLCESKDPLTGLDGIYTNVVNANGNLVDGIESGVVNVSQAESFVYCDQSWQGYIGFPFPPTSRLQTDSRRWTAQAQDDDLQWMTSFQETLTNFYGWFAFVLAVLFVLLFFGRRAYVYFVSIFVGVFEPEGSSQYIDFSSNPEIYAYVPQIKVVGTPFPFLVCDVDDIDQGLIGWNDPAHSYDYHNLIYDVPHKSLRRKERILKNTRSLTKIVEHEDWVENSDRLSFTQPSGGVEVQRSGSGSSARPIYSIVKHYPTKWQIELSKKDQ